MNFKEAVSNLELMSEALEKVANKDENYNTHWASQLEQMSWEMHKQANELRNIEYLFDVTQHKNTNKS